MTETAGDTQPQETEPDTTTRTFDVSWVVPVRDEEYQLDVCLAGTSEVLAQRMVSPGAQTVVLKLTGSGVVYYDLYINGDFVETKSVEFTPKKVEP